MIKPSLLEQKKETDPFGKQRVAPPVVPQSIPVFISGYFYVVNLGEPEQPDFHHVGTDHRCTCAKGASCPAVKAVSEYLRNGGEHADEIPAGFYPVVPQVCPICGAGTSYLAELDNPHRGAGWICAKGGKSHYWEAHVRVLQENLKKNPWLIPPIYAPDGQLLHPGVRRSEVISET
jgi:hypothetical protein